jgi:hypothetical protein
MEEKVMRAWLQIAEYVQSIGYGAVQSVHENMQADQTAGTRVINTYKGA